MRVDPGRYWNTDEVQKFLGLTNRGPSYVRKLLSRLNQWGFIHYDDRPRVERVMDNFRKISYRNIEVLDLYLHLVREGEIQRHRTWRKTITAEKLQHVALVGWPWDAPTIHEDWVIPPRSEATSTRW